MVTIDEPPATEHISVDIQGACLTLTLHRPDKFNALNVAMITELIGLLDWSAQRSAGQRDALHDAQGNPYFRTLILRGEGTHFCAGADINMMRDAGANTPEENRLDSERLDRLFNGLWSHPCFTIAAIQGVALGGGAGLIACCDYVVGTANMRIALSEGKLGILPAVIGPYVYRRVGSANFRRLAMQASRIGADEALRIGFVERVVDSPSELEGAVEAIVAELMTTGPSAVTLAKELALGFDRWTQNDEALRLWTLDFTSRMRGSNEGQEGLSSFLEKRPPQWKPMEDE
jgi:methylglutaconyl-CoA hydratase